METQQDLSTDELIFSLEQTVSEDSALRKDLTELFSNSFDPEIFAKLRERNPFFTNIVSNIIRNKLESQISGLENKYVKEREPIHKNIGYYESLPARIKEVEEREGKNSEEYMALTKENGRKGPIL
ncbi:hypothetical protein KY326_01905, partial [Candidatus Woesearchaeota archaeon]|nr:hypothetical protein [Candidatus Woesearchaeota archaeon]